MYQNVVIMENKRTVTSISLSKTAKEDLDLLTKEEEKTRSEIIREALRQYKFERRWEKLRKIGSRVALKMGIETDEDILKILDR